ncbi:hypothetical protein B0H14DRAFT_3472082 [Mycena olivaceomarginata]|nr:hypothetical protein B0H14DRAFT_3472082 [Mycena olivaceomarginata]
MSSAFSATPSVSKASNAKTGKGGKGKSKVQGDGYGPDGNTLPKHQAVASLGDDGEEAPVVEKGDVGDPRPMTAADDAHREIGACGENNALSTTNAPSATNALGATDALGDGSPATQRAVTQGAEGPWPATGGVNPAFKSKIVTEVNLQVKGWFSYRKTVAHRALKNPFLEWLEKHADYAEAVEARFIRDWPKANMEAKYALDFRCKCARDLVAEEDDTTRAKLTAELEAQHEVAMAQYTGRMNGAASPEEPDTAKREACRANLAQVAQPFLDGVAKLTGPHLMLLAGAAPPAGSDKFIMTA